MNDDEEYRELHSSAREKRDGGFTPSSPAFPRQSIHCYRAIVALPFIIVVLLTTSVPFLVLSIVYWDDGCWSGNAWWYRPTTVCAVSNVLALCIAPLVVFVFARPDDGSGSARSALAFIGISIILWPSKALEIASLIAAPILSHWCNASWIAIADLGAACVLMGALAGMMAYFEEAKSEVRIDLKHLVLNLGMLSFGGCAFVLGVLGSIALLFSLFGIHIACIIVAALSLADDDCSGSIWSNPPLPLVVTSVMSLLAMVVASVACVSDLAEASRKWVNSCLLVPFFAISVTAAGWLTYSLEAGGCDSGDRVWWFGLVQAVYSLLAPLVWLAVIAVMACAGPALKRYEH